MSGFDPAGVWPASLSEVIARRQPLLPPGVDSASSPDVLRELCQLTAQLIACYRQAGRLGADPFEDVRGREIHVLKGINL
jgi:hypothetical protein